MATAPGDEILLTRNIKTGGCATEWGHFFGCLGLASRSVTSMIADCAGPRRIPAARAWMVRASCRW